MPIRDVAMRFAAREQTNVETLVSHLERLTRERQDLREQKGDVDALERNRLEIVEAQWDLSRALIDRYRPLERAT